MLAFVLGLMLLPRGPATTPRALNVVGLLLLSGGLPLFTFRIIEAGNRQNVLAALPPACILAGTAAMTAFGAKTLRRRLADAPPRVLDLTLFGPRLYAAAQTKVLLTGDSLFGGLIVLPLYFEWLRGESVVATGLLLLACGAVAAATLQLGDACALLVIILARDAGITGFRTAFALLTAGAVVALVVAVWLACEQRVARTMGPSMSFDVR